MQCLRSTPVNASDPLSRPARNSCVAAPPTNAPTLEQLITRRRHGRSARLSLPSKRTQDAYQSESVDAISNAADFGHHAPLRRGEYVISTRTPGATRLTHKREFRDGLDLRGGRGIPGRALQDRPIARRRRRNTSAPRIATHHRALA